MSRLSAMARRGRLKTPRMATANVTGTVLRVICAYVNTSTGKREERFKIRVQWPNGVVMVADAAYLEAAPE